MSATPAPAAAVTTGRYWQGLYELAFELALPLLLVRQLWLAWRKPAYADRWWQRFGYWPVQPADRPLIWVHAVSVGEVRAALSIIDALETGGASYRILVSTATPTGHAALQKARPSGIHAYAPLDARSVIHRILKRIRPAALIIMERELWPGLIGTCQRQGVPVLLANARLSARSQSRYARLPQGLLHRVLGGLVIAAQSPEDAGRFMALGARPAHTFTLGNTKLDSELALQSQSGPVLRREADVWIAASTHKGEEEAALRVHQDLSRRGLARLLVLVPRHPERAEAMAHLVLQSGLRLGRHSAGGRIGDRGIDVLLVDEMGVLRDYYAAAAVAFVGGTLVPVGGHSLFEPLLAATPVVVGPHHQSVAELVALGHATGTVISIGSEGELGAAIVHMLESQVSMTAAMAVLRQQLEGHVGAGARNAALLASMIRGR